MLIGLKGKMLWDTEVITMEEVPIESHHKEASEGINLIKSMEDTRERTMEMPIFQKDKMFHLRLQISIMEHSQPKISIVSMQESNQLKEETIKKFSVIKQTRFKQTNTAKIYQMLKLILLVKVLPEIEMDTFYQVPFRMAEDKREHTYLLPTEADMVKSKNAQTVSPQVILSSLQLRATALLSEVVLP
jgi:hypothetical protein